MTETLAGLTDPPTRPTVAAGASRGRRPVDLVTVGVEEEFLLYDLAAAQPAQVAERVMAAVADAGRPPVQHEFLTTQIEIASQPVLDLADLGEELSALRRTVATAAATVGAALVAVGAPPLAFDQTPRVFDTPRFRRMVTEVGALAPGPGVCGTHIHVGIDDRDLGVQVINHMRPWLPVLGALGTNSPYFGGNDTGYASWRAMVWGQWPSVESPPHLRSAADYDATVARLIDSGALMDYGMLYWHARLSAHVPTVEVRVGDVGLTAADTVLAAALVRALAATGLRLARAGVMADPVPHHVLSAAHWRSARDGLRGHTFDPATGAFAPTQRVLGRLVALVTPELRRHGDLGMVTVGVARARSQGAGADRQRAVTQAAGAHALLPYLAEQTVVPTR
ncbi:glutamate--cysteine ligase [Pilimelia columellifera]|uniref:Putative glutamate--cysteine ligase 2 n=1 Tax=Pilimelia columellifera subsp. columellifera TaxID=706583 RepID=A0ABN3NJK5_9ACTN